MSSEAVIRFGSEPILGWRAWRVRYLDGLPEALESIAQPLGWPGRKPMRAHCLYAWRKRRLWNHHAVSGHGTTPALEHTCGIYATRTPEQARSWSGHFGRDGQDQRVIGRVALWGRVLVHSSGWRAELAYPAEFVVPPKLDHGLDPEALAFWLEARYGVPAEIGGHVWERPAGVLGRIAGPLRRLVLRP
jgi:hypothetical protein